MIRISQLVSSVPASKTMAVSGKAGELRRQGIDVVNLSVGEPDGDPPAAAIEAAHAALSRGENKYGPLAGLPELREAVADGYRRDHGLDVAAENVLITMGGKQALYNLALTLFGPGDEVLLLTPSWVSYASQIMLSGATAVPVVCSASDGFQPDPDAIEAAITPRTRGIILNSPCNPTGCVFDRSRVEAIARIACAHDLVIVSDEIYDAVTFDGAQNVHVAALSPEVAARTVTVNGVAKAFAMTGWRVGWFVGPAAVVRAASKIQSHSTSGVCAINQRGALAAITSDLGFLKTLAADYQRRRDLMVDGLARLPGFRLGPTPRGAFYLFPMVEDFFGRRAPDGAVIESALDFANLMLDVGRVALVPGEAFGEPRGVRLSYATSQDRLEAALSRIGAAISSLR